MSVYIGPERRKGERRSGHDDLTWTQTHNRRSADRREEALAGVIVGLDAEDMATLAAFWQGYEAARLEREAAAA